MREIAIHDTQSGELKELAPRDPGTGRDLRLRPDRLQPHPHRQRAPLRGLQPAHALPRARGLRGRPRGQRHRRQRQDLRRRRPPGAAQRRAGRADDVRLPAGHRRAGNRPPDARAAGLRDDRADRRLHPGADRRRPRLRGRRRRLLPRALGPRLRAALPSPARQDGPGRGRRGDRAQAATRSTSRCGRRTSRARTRPGRRPGAMGAPAGTSSARRWPRSCSAWASTSTAAARTSSSPTTRTRPRRRARPAARSWRASGCTTA